MQAQKMQTQTFTHQQQQTLDYGLYLPEGYDGKTQFPLMIFLHGAGERGGIDLVQQHAAIPRDINAGKMKFPFVVAAPACPAGEWWPHYFDALNALVDSLLADYAVDPQRVYLTGLSLGGNGTWHWAARNPERFAAVVPVCGFCVPVLLPENWDTRLASLPIWAFHGAKDDVVPPEASTSMVEAVRAAGGDVKYTLYPDADHNSWDPAYAEPELIPWMLSHSLAARG